MATSLRWIRAKSGQGEVEMIRMIKSAKVSAVKARTQAVNQMKALAVTAPAELRGARASVRAVWTIPRRLPSTLFDLLLAVTVS